jgi:hypothetical protein
MRYALRCTRSPEIDAKSPQKNKKGFRKKFSDGCNPYIVGGMKAAEPKKRKRLASRKRNPFDCEGWRRFVMRSVRADQAARARVRATGETLH